MPRKKKSDDPGMGICYVYSGQRWCSGHNCVVCGKKYYCQQKPRHECPPRMRHTKGEMGIERGMSLHERLALAKQMRSMD